MFTLYDFISPNPLCYILLYFSVFLHELEILSLVVNILCFKGEHTALPHSFYNSTFVLFVSVFIPSS